MHFEFRSSSLDLVESFWQFEIAEQNISVPFLLVGQTRDPAVTFDRSHINFRSVLIGLLAFIRNSVAGYVNLKSRVNCKIRRVNCYNFCCSGCILSLHVFLHIFCSKFRTLSSGRRIFKIS